MDLSAAESVKWVDVKSFDDIMRSHKLDTSRNEMRLMGFIKTSNISERVMLRNEAFGTNFAEAFDQEDPKLEPWSEKSCDIIGCLIRSLWFSEMHQRRETICDNFEGTFKWIYYPPRDVDRPWHSFSTWLTEGLGIYWITGKAGSGKSTLMRMLHENKRTIELLRTWCCDLPLVTASFFFWNSGSKMQMSQDGLLRSVLVQMVEQRLQQGNCDTLKEKLVIFSTMQVSLHDFQFKDLLRLFRLVIEDGATATKFFLILDGLDEFEGEKSQLVSLIHTVGKYEHVKVCVSSRPWTIFEDGFCQQPSLVLQHLTHHDILIYAREKLSKEPAFREMSWADPSNASELIRSITRKASGVFLWVVLTVDSLIKGLADGDRVKDLEARLEEMPEELEDLFRKMLHGLEGRYFQDAARLFQIHRATRWPGFGGRVGTRLPLLVYGFADEHGADHDATSKWPPKALTAKERFMVSVSMKRRINSRCNGLLEIDHPVTFTDRTWSDAKGKQLDSWIAEAETGNQSVLPKLNSYGIYLAKTSVQYLHRTVKDYLETPDIWRSIESSAPTEGDDYWIISLCLGSIMLWKNVREDEMKSRTQTQPTLQHPSALPARMPSAGSSLYANASMQLSEPMSLLADQGEDSQLMLENCLKHAIGFLPNGLQTHTRLLDALGAVLFEVPTAEVECNQPRALHSAIWTNLSPRFVFEDFLSLAAHCNLFEYVTAKISFLSPADQRTTASRLLVIVTMKRGQWLRIATSSQQENVNIVAESGAPRIAPESSATKDYELYADNRKMMQILLQYGADPDFQAYGTSARQVIDHRRWELAGSLDVQSILQSFDSASNSSRRLTKRAKSIFHGQT